MLVELYSGFSSRERFLALHLFSLQLTIVLIYLPLCREQLLCFKHNSQLSIAYCRLSDQFSTYMKRVYYSLAVWRLKPILSACLRFHSYLSGGLGRGRRLPYVAQNNWADLSVWRPVQMRFYRLSLRHESVLGICRLVVSLFRRCITVCKECKLYRQMTLVEVQVK